MNFEDLERKAKKLYSEGWGSFKLLSLIENKQREGLLNGPKITEGKIIVAILEKMEGKKVALEEEELLDFDGTLKGVV